MLLHEYGLIEKRLDRKSIQTKHILLMQIRLRLSILQKHLKVTVGWVYAFKQPQIEKQMKLFFILDYTKMRLNINKESVGRLGTNLIYGAYKFYEDPKVFLKSLYDNIDSYAIEIDLINFSGPDFFDVDNRLMSLQLIKNGYTDAVIFGPEGNNLLPAGSYTRSMY